MEKVIRDGKVAVIIADEGNWYTNDLSEENKRMIFDPKVVALIEAGEARRITEAYMRDVLKYERPYKDPWTTLKIRWIPLGKRFDIHPSEMGGEYIVTEDDLPFKA